MNKTLSIVPILLATGCMADMSDDLGDDVASDQAAIFGSDACKDVDFKITNSYEVSGSPRDIHVLSVDYYSASEGRWYTEDLANTTIDVGASHWWYNEDLQYAENDTITMLKVKFKYVEFDGDWSDVVTQTEDIPDVVCHAGQNFYVTLD